MKSLLTAVIALLCASVAAQEAGKKSVVIGSMTTRPNALLIVNPPNSNQGVLLPQLSTGQRISLKPASPSEDGLLVFDTNFQSYYYWSNGAWTKVGATRRNHSYYSIDPTDFRHLAVTGGLTQGIAIFETDDTFVTVLSDASGDKIMAPINLPDGAVIEEMTLYYLDNAAENIHLTFIRKKLTGDNEEIFNWQSSGASLMPRSETFNNFMGKGTIDEQNYTYRILVDFDIDPAAVVTSPAQARQRVYGVRIKYEL